LLILYIIRTRKSFIKSKPGNWLPITGIIAFCITIYLPVSPFAGLLGFSVAHVQQVVAIAIILAAYVVTADILKIIFFRMSEKAQKK
jgi:Mg2+-importing ATPase